MRLRQKVYHQLFDRPDAGESLSSANWVISIVVIAAVLTTILHTEPGIRTADRAIFFSFELVFGLFFAVEYAARVWSVAEAEDGRSAWSTRLQFIIRPMSLLDLFVVVATLSPALLEDAAIFRMIRLVRILALARFGKFSRALDDFLQALKERRQDLYLTIAVGAGLLLFSATALYWAEGEAQPEAFGSIPRALWWAVATLTTVGYGDVTPITVLGKALASLVALGGIGLVAMPAGIMASAYSDAISRKRARDMEAKALDTHD